MTLAPLDAPRRCPGCERTLPADRFCLAADGHGTLYRRRVCNACRRKREVARRHTERVAVDRRACHRLSAEALAEINACREACGLPPVTEETAYVP